MRLAPDGALNTHALHQPGHRATGHIEALAAKLVPNLANAVDSPVLFEDAQNLRPQRLVSARTTRQQGGISPLGQVIVVG